MGCSNFYNTYISTSLLPSMLEGTQTSTNIQGNAKNIENQKKKHTPKFWSWTEVKVESTLRKNNNCIDADGERESKEETIRNLLRKLMFWVHQTGVHRQFHTFLLLFFNINFQSVLIDVVAVCKLYSFFFFHFDHICLAH